eukprot:GHVR01054607.1.p1 GENE.GHVR01054607.1~~GHVR01054607.1.p1  ORF type:complete len:173 (+),score=48.57 GHVR01054607.1:52-570(+)
MSSSSDSGGEAEAAFSEALKCGWRAHPDSGVVDLIPIPVVVVISRWDLFQQKGNQESRRTLINALRYHAHINGASIVCTSTKIASSLQQFRNILKFTAISHTHTSRHTSFEQKDTNKPICIPCRQDSLESIPFPPSALTHNNNVWSRVVEEIFPSKKGEDAPPRVTHTKGCG